MDYKISVALCTYNGEKYIKEQLNSILNQTIRPNEIVICDDASTDNTIEIIKEIINTNPFVKWRLLRNNKTLGVTKNFEQAISTCNEEIIFTADQDDVWLKNKIEFVIKQFTLNTNLNLVFTNAYLVDSNLSIKKHTLWDVYDVDEKKIQGENIINTLLKYNIMTGATMAFKRNLIAYILPFSDEWLHDYWIAMTACLLGDFHGINSSLVLYRQHDNNVIGAKKKTFIQKIKMYGKNFKKVNLIREKKYKMIIDLRRFAIKNEDYIEKNKLIKVNNCYEYWRKMVCLNYSSKANCIKLIYVELIKGNYREYYTGIRGVLRDFIILMIGLIRKRQK